MNRALERMIIGFKDLYIQGDDDIFWACTMRPAHFQRAESSSLNLRGAGSNNFHYYTLFLIGARCVCSICAGEDCQLLPFAELARSKQDPINCGQGAQYLYWPPPAGGLVARVGIC